MRKYTLLSTLKRQLKSISEEGLWPFILITASVFLPAVQTALLMCPDREAEIWSFIQNIICPENQLIR